MWPFPGPNEQLISYLAWVVGLNKENQKGGETGFNTNFYNCKK